MAEIVEDARVRSAAFSWLAKQTEKHGDVLPRSLLATGFELDGQRVHLVGPQGIFKPKVLDELPLSITTAPGGRYDDAFDANGLLRYRYRGSDPDHPDNRRLRLAWRRGVPLIYFHGIVPGKYLAAWPVYIVGDDPSGLYVTVVLEQPNYFDIADGAADLAEALGGADLAREAGRSYATAQMRVRLHQRSFRERVLEAYRRQCAFCRFRHEELLDAAHIVPDAHSEGEPIVQNGLALCSLHHRAFDRHFIGVTPDYRIEVRPDILEESDGPTLVHGFQVLHGKRILLPRASKLWPDRDLLSKRHEEFRAAV
jgi:putative restriction endonuclease